MSHLRFILFQVHQVDPGGGGSVREEVVDNNSFELNLFGGDDGDFFGNDGDDVDMMDVMFDVLNTVDVATTTKANNNENDKEGDTSMINMIESTQGARDTDDGSVEDEILTRAEVGRRRKDKLAELVSRIYCLFSNQEYGIYLLR